MTTREIIENKLDLWDPNWKSMPGLWNTIDTIMSLLPPEGETSGTIHDATEQIRIEALVRDSRGEYRINLTKVEEILHRFFAEPASSSEKAHAVNGIECEYCDDRLRSSSEKALREVFNFIGDMDDWDGMQYRQWALEQVRVLASSPAPSGQDRESCTEPAPEAPK